MALIRFEEEVPLTLPPSGYVIIYADPADEHIKQIDSSGIVRDLTEGGQEFIVINNTGSLIPKGAPVHFNSWDDVNNLPEVVLTDASDSNAMPAIGLANNDIIDGGQGVVVFQGSVSGIDTSLLTEGQPLWIDVTPGQLTTSRPIGGVSLIQQIADVGRVDAVEGSYVIHGALRVNELPNLPEDTIWIGDVDGHPITVDKNTLGDVQQVQRLSYTGWLIAPTLAVNAGDNTQFDVTAAGVGYVIEVTNPASPISTLVNVPIQTGIPGDFLGSVRQTYVVADITGAVIQRTTRPVANDLVDVLFIGNLTHSDGASPPNDIFQDATDTQYTNYSMTTTLRMFLQAFGGINLDGLEYSGVSGTLNIMHLAGVGLRIGANYDVDRNIPDTPSALSENPVPTIVKKFENVSGILETVPPVDGFIDPDAYNNNGVLTTVPNNNFTIQRIFFFYGSDTTIVYYGNDIYQNQEAALAAVNTEQFEEHPDTFEAVFKAFIIVQEGATDTDDPAQVTFVNRGPVRALSGGGGGGGGGGVTNFDELTDTPFDKSGAADFICKVGPLENLIEYLSAQAANSLGHGEPAISGVYAPGGRVTQVNTTQVEVNAGSGQIVNFYDDYLDGVKIPVSWLTQTVTLPDLNVNTATSVYIDAAGDVQSHPGTPSSAELKQRVYLARTINNTNTSEIIDVITAPSIIGNVSALVQDSFYFTGAETSGGDVDQTSDTGTNGTMAISVETIEVFFPNINIYIDPATPHITTIAATDPANWAYMLQDGFIVSVPNTLIDPTQYDNGGILTAVPTTGGGVRTTIQYVYQVLNGSNVVLFGQTIYNDLITASAALSEDILSIVVPDILKDAAFPLAAILVTQNCTDLSNTATAEIRQLNLTSGGGGSGESNTGENLGTGEGVFAQKAAERLQFKSLVNDDDSIELESDAIEITVRTSGAFESQLVTSTYTVLPGDKKGIEYLVDQSIVDAVAIVLPDPTLVDDDWHIIVNGGFFDGRVIDIHDHLGAVVANLESAQRIRFFKISGVIGRELLYLPILNIILDETIYGDLNNSAWESLGDGNYAIFALGSQLSNLPSEITVNPVVTYFLRIRLNNTIVYDNVPPANDFFKQDISISENAGWTENNRMFARSGTNLTSAITTGWSVFAFLDDISGGGGGGVTHFSAQTRTTTQSLPVSTETTLIPNVAIGAAQTGTALNTSTGVVTVPAGGDGRWEIKAQGDYLINGTNNPPIMEARIKVNGSIVVRDRQPYGGNTVGNFGFSIGGKFDLVATDTLEVALFNETGQAVSLQPDGFIFNHERIEIV